MLQVGGAPVALVIDVDLCVPTDRSINFVQESSASKSDGRRKLTNVYLHFTLTASSSSTCLSSSPSSSPKIRSGGPIVPATELHAEAI